MPFNAEVRFEISGRYDKLGVLEQPVSQLAIALARAFTDGNGLNQASVFYTGSRTLAASTNESLDLNGTALLDSFGAALALTRIKGIIIAARPENTTNLTVGNVTNSISTLFGATYSLVLQPGEMLSKITPSSAGYVVTPGTADLLNIANAAGGSATYDIVIIGA